MKQGTYGKHATSTFNDPTFSSNPVSISESNMCYIVTVSMPGAKKENIVVYAEGNVATVVQFKENNIEDKEVGNPDELNIVFRQKINLPEDADADFIHAEYDHGVLHLFISKSSKAGKVRFHPVAVY